MMTQTRLNTQGAPPLVQYSQPDGYQQASKNWRVNTGFKKLQKRIVDRQKSGKGHTSNKPPLPALNVSARKSGHATSRLHESTSALTSQLHNDVSNFGSKRKHNKNGIQSRSMLLPSAPTSGGKTPGFDKKAGPSEFSMSLQYELYRTSNNGLARISARMKKNAFRLPSKTSLDFSDSLSFENNYAEKCSDQPSQHKLPIIDKASPLLKTEVAKLDSQYEEDFEEELDNRIMRWIKNCRVWEAFDGQPYADLDKKQRKSSSKPHLTSTPRSKVTDSGMQGLDRSKTCL